VTEKFSYYDLLAYLVPGTVVVWAIIQLAEELGVLRLIATGSTLLDASAFVVIAFIAGHLVQAEAQRRLDTSHRYSVFPDGLPSNSFLVCGEKDDKGTLWCSDSRRLAYIAAAHRHGFLDDKQVEKLKTAPSDEEGTKKAKQASQDVYGEPNLWVVQRPGDDLCRGSCYLLRRPDRGSNPILRFHRGTTWYLWQGFTGLLLYPVLVILSFSYATVSFRLRARNRGKHHAREVFDALLSAPTLEPENTTGEGTRS
jgi:hypothetical protein